MDWTAILSELGSATPYAVLFVLGFYLFYKMHNKSVNNLKEAHKDAIEAIKYAYADAYRNLTK